MSILIAVATRHGSTREIADAIAAELRGTGHTVQVQDITDGLVLENHTAVVIGSAVYMGSWLPEAAQFIEDHHVQLRGKAVWLFSSGPLGSEDPKLHGDPAQISKLIESTGARGHRTFVGKLDSHRLSLGERFVTKMVNAPEGDFRDWDAVRGWADEIAGAMPAAIA